MGKGWEGERDAQCVNLCSLSMGMVSGNLPYLPALVSLLPMVRVLGEGEEGQGGAGRGREARARAIVTSEPQMQQIILL